MSKIASGGSPLAIYSVYTPVDFKGLIKIGTQTGKPNFDKPRRRNVLHKFV